MIRFAMISLAIAVCISIAGFAIFLAGMNHAPRQVPGDEMDFVQGICDLSRKEPWKPEIKTSCDFVQSYLAVDYKCEKIAGCYTQRRLDGEVRF